MRKSDYNIEFAHIYVNENFASEHCQASRIVKEKVREIRQHDKSYVLTVLIDDYNPSDYILNVKKFLEELRKLGTEPDYAVYESKLVSYKDQILNKMNGKIKNQYLKYIRDHGKCPCSFLIAIWHLLRLGFLDPKSIVDSLENRPFVAQKIITILPQRYTEIEKKALEIIKSTEFGDFVENRLEYIFF